MGSAGVASGVPGPGALRCQASLALPGFGYDGASVIWADMVLKTSCSSQDMLFIMEFVSRKETGFCSQV